jgi:DNA-binding NarL/FixJ family response regulator
VQSTQLRHDVLEPQPALSDPRPQGRTQRGEVVLCHQLASSTGFRSPLVRYFRHSADFNRIWDGEPPIRPQRAEVADWHTSSRRSSLPTVLTIRAVLGEDNYLAREGISRALEAAPDVDLVRTCVDLDSLRSAVDELEPDVVVTDIRMPPTNTDEGIRLAGELRRSHPGIGVVVLSQHSDPLYAMTLFQDGSERRAYLLKERVRDPGDLSRALREVADGGSVVDGRIVEGLLEVERRRQASLPLADLTQRELEILGLLAEGLSNAAIATKLVITKRAVEGHVGAIFSKLDLGTPGDVSRRVRAALMYLAGQTA